jgi:hypothetical protein
MYSKLVYLFILFLTVISCKQKSPDDRVQETVQLTETKQEEFQGMEPPPNYIVKENRIEVSARLLYPDNTVSSFDVLNDSSVALWNTPTGGGDAAKPSDKLAVCVIGDLKNIHLFITNGSKTVIDQELDSVSVSMIIRLDNTGCEPITITAVRKSDIVFKKSIPFHCGE